MLREDMNTEDRSKLLDQWERTTFRIYGLLDNDARVKVGDYVRVSKSIFKEKNSSTGSLVKMIADIGKEFAIDEAVEFLRTKDCYTNWQSKLRYFFYRYEEYLAERSKKQISEIDWNIIWKGNLNESIEHILPQEKSRACWSNEFTDDSHKQLLNNLGNLCLLSQPLNSASKNLCISNKIEFYKKTHLLANQDILVLDNGNVRTQWKPEDIKSRTEELVSFAREQWKDLK